MKDTHFLQSEPIGPLYKWFADETAPTSPAWERLCRWIADTPQVHDRLGALPGEARQPNRFLAAVRFLNGPTHPGPVFLDWFQQEWPRIEQIVLTRTTQTNEPGRTAVTAQVLASLHQPVVLLELGASAGLCLLPDRYVEAGLAFPCRVSGPSPGDPADLVVAGRLGVDRNPLDVTEPDTHRWLRALVWPGEEDREARLARALDIAAADPPEVRAADLTQAPHEMVAALLGELRHTHPEATPVVLHSAFLAYLDQPEREAVVAAIRDSGARWVSMEGIRVVPGIEQRLGLIGDPPDRTSFVVALDGEPLGWAQAHGRWVRWVRA